MVVILLFIGVAVQPSIAFDSVKNPIIPISKVNTLYVGGSGEGNYTTIQSAINHAYDGDTVFVYDEGSPYYEHLIVNKSINLIGEDKNTTVIDGSGSKDVVCIYSRVNMSGFTIQNSGHDKSGILVFSSYSIIKGNIISNNDNGIYLLDYNNNNITSNNISNNSIGIVLFFSNNNTIIGNNNSNNRGMYGMIFYYSNNNTIIGNIISKNDGIFLYYSNSNNIIGNNIILNKESGIALFFSNNNTIMGNNNSNNRGSGISLVNSPYNTITGNNISLNNDDGIYIRYSNSNNIIGNNIISNNKYGIVIYGLGLYVSKGNTILKNNLINNKRNAIFYSQPSSLNHWDQNYWNRPRILPKLIFGRTSLIGKHEFPWINFDWRPALKPYDIEGVI